MECWYCKTNKFEIHEYVNLLKVGICKNCGRTTIETNDVIPYQTYSKCSVNNTSEQVISKWNDYSHFKLILATDKITGEIKLNIYYPHEGKLQCERIDFLALGYGLGVDQVKLIREDMEMRNDIKIKVKRHDDSILVKLWRLIFPLPKIPEYKIYSEG